MCAILGAVIGRCQEMENVAVVPHVHWLEYPFARDVRLDPCQRIGDSPKTIMRPTQRRAGHVEDGQTLQPRETRASTRCESPPPTSSTHVSGVRPAASII